MSDALTDIAMDQRRSYLFDKYIENLLLYLKNPTEEGYKNLRESAEDVDGVPRGYWRGATTLSRSLDDRIKCLQEGNKEEWGRLLFCLRSNFSSNVYKKLKDISPFSKKALVAVDYGCGFATIRDLEGLLSNVIRSKDLKTFNCDKYLVVLPIEDLEKTEVVWIGCAMGGQNKPRDSKGKYKEAVVKAEK